jgi:hypothetical protein
MRNPWLHLSFVFVLAHSFLARSADALELSLQNGWTHAPFSTSRAEVFVDDEIVHFKGAVGGGTTALITTLPPAMRPATNVYVTVDLCNARKGRLFIQPSGNVTVETAPDPFETAQCFTSLDGARFARSDVGFTPLTLQNGWVGAPFSTSNPAGRLIDGRVYLKGAMSSGTNTNPFTLPPALRPEATVWIPIDLCGNVKGRLVISPDGIVFVDGPVTSAQCFTSLDGASFVPSAPGSTPLALINGWNQYGFGTSDAAVSMVDGIVSFKGAIATGGVNDIAFVLPPTMRPTETTYIPVDMFFNAKGRLIVHPSGQVQVRPAAAFSDAQAFTSLDGASFIPTPNGFQPLALRNGWGNGFFGTPPSAAALYDGIVHFQGAVTHGTSDTLFTLPITMRPDSLVYVPADLCDANVGRLIIDPNGSVRVQAPAGFTVAQCFVSLEGVTFARSETGFTALGLTNGWLPYGFGTSAPAAAIVDEMVQLKGAISSGTVGPAFNLPPSMRPASTAFVVVDLCNATKGRVFVETNGNVTVDPLGPDSDGQCFTSLEGAKFAPASNVGFSALSPINGWFASGFADTPGARLVRDIVYLKGALGTSGVINHALTMPGGLRPSAETYLPIDLCNSNKGRMLIQASGAASVSALTDFAHAQCFSSLDGVSYAVPEPAGASALVAGLLLIAGTQHARGRRMRVN